MLIFVRAVICLQRFLELSKNIIYTLKYTIPNKKKSEILGMNIALI